MRRVEVEPRPDLEQRLRAFEAWPSDGGRAYYDESAAYVFTAEQVDTLAFVVDGLEALVRQAVEHALHQERWDDLGIPPALGQLAQTSWQRGDPSVYGRMDIAWDGTGDPKLLEYNADTPTALFEAAVLQWEWLRSRSPDLDQFNALHECLIAQWARLREQSGLSRLTLAGMLDEDDDRVTLAYLEDVAHQAGWTTHLCPIEALGLKDGAFVDDADTALQALFKLYPWDWLAREDFFAPLAASSLAVMEAPWRVVASSKGLLPILWELFPDHPNLLPAAFEPGAITGPKVRKPVLGREGADVTLHGVPGAPEFEAGPYAGQRAIWQQWTPLPDFDGWRPVLGCWLVGGEAEGLGVREDRSLVTGPGARFRPHWIED